MPTPFDEYVQHSGYRLVRFAYALCGDRHLAEDLVQDILARIYPRWSRIEAEQPDAYLRMAIVRAHLSWLRRRPNQERAAADLPDPPPPADFTTRHALRDELWHALASLTRTQRAVLVLRFYEDLDDRQIAETLGCAQATVRGHAARGLATLRTRVPLPAEDAR